MLEKIIIFVGYTMMIVLGLASVFGVISLIHDSSWLEKIVVVLWAVGIFLTVLYTILDAIDISKEVRNV